MVALQAPGQCHQQRRLAGAARPDERRDRSRGEAGRDVAQQLLFTELVSTVQQSLFARRVVGGTRPSSSSASSNAP